MNYIKFFKRLLIVIKFAGYGLAIFFALLGFTTGKNLNDSLITSTLTFLLVAGITKTITWLFEGFLKGNEPYSVKKESIPYSPNFYATIHLFCLAAICFALYEVWKTYSEFGFDVARILGGLLAVAFFMYSADYSYRKWQNKKF